MRRRGRRIGWPSVAVLGLLVAGCGHASDAVDCQLQNHSSDWFDGYHYDMCMDAQERTRREWAQHEREQEACRKGDAHACLAAGVVDLPVNERVAHGELETACSASIGEACWRVGTMMYGDFSIFLPRHRARARALFVRACDLGEARGCADVARVHPDEATRSDYAERACRMGAHRSCVDAGDARRASDPARASQLYEIGCGAGEREACVALDRLRHGA